MTFTSSLPHIAAGLVASMDHAARAGAELVEQRAKARVHVGTGRLRDAIHVDREGVGEYSVAAGDQSVFYGHVVEHGDATNPPRPFLVPALEESRAQIVAKVVEELRALL